MERGAGFMAAPDSIVCLALHVEREYGHGYRMRVAGELSGGAYALVRHFDGSTFLLHSDRHGLVSRIEPA
jgi:hypothetical protein